MSSLHLQFGASVCHVDDGNVRSDARDTHLDAVIEVPPEAILELFTFNGDARHAKEIAVHEIEKQGYFDGVAECLIHRVHSVGDSFQILCTILPLSHSTTAATIRSLSKLEERHIGLGVFSNFCNADTDVILQIDLKIYVLRLRRGLYSLTVLPVQRQFDATVLNELQDSGAVDMHAPRTYCFSLWAEMEDFPEHSSGDTGNLGLPQQDVLSAHIFEREGGFRALSRSEIATQLARHLVESPLPIKPHKPLLWLLLQLKRKHRSLYVAEWFSVAALAVVILHNIWGISAELEQASSLSERGDALNLQVRHSTEPEINRQLYAAQVRFIETLTSKATVTSYELLPLISEVRQIVSGVIPVKEVEIVRANETPSGTKANNSNQATSPKKNHGFAVRIVAVIPSSYESRLRIMRSLLEASEQRGLRMSEQQLSRGKDQGEGETANETLSLIFAVRND